jgi:signal transduction histidine kinase
VAIAKHKSDLKARLKSDAKAGARALLDLGKELWERLNVHPERVSLGWWSALTNFVVVALIVGGISVAAIDRLRDLANAQGEARVQLAAALAREDLSRYGEDMLASARALALRPELQRLLADGNAAALEPVLRRFCAASGGDACAAFSGSAPIAEAKAAMAWPEVLRASAEQGERFLAVPKSGDPVQGAIATVIDRTVDGAVAGVGHASAESAQNGGKVSTSSPAEDRVQGDGHGENKVAIVRLLGPNLAKLLSERVGLEVRLINYRLFTQAPIDELTALHTAALSDGRSAVQRIDKLDLYAASVPVFASTGEAIAFIEVRLPARDIDAVVHYLVKRLLITAGILAVLAVLAGFILGRQVAEPVAVLTAAAVRLGQGDFSVSIPTGGTAEVNQLARTMEGMRRNLVELTGTLRRREAEAQAVLGGIVEGVYAVDKDRRIRYLNPQAARLLGITAEQAIGRFCGDVLQPRPENGRRLCDVRCPIFQARSAGRAVATELLSPTEGSLRTMAITSAALMDGLQVQVIRDETELESVRRARDSVLANISHEFRTPLAAQLASIELLRAGLGSMTEQQVAELVLSLERGVLRLTRLIDNLLESVRIESGQLAIRRQSVALGDIIEGAQTLAGALLAQRRQTLEVSLPQDLPRIDGDEQRLTQVFVNLLANAAKFAPEGSVVRIGAAAEGDKITAWVEDEGPGVPEIASGTIFERFYRGPDQEPEPGGLGLGLWIVKSIVDRHGGTITATRTADQRTRFSITLPVESEI